MAVAVADRAVAVSSATGAMVPVAAPTLLPADPPSRWVQPIARTTITHRPIRSRFREERPSHWTGRRVPGDLASVGNIVISLPACLIRRTSNYGGASRESEWDKGTGSRSSFETSPSATLFRGTGSSRDRKGVTASLYAALAWTCPRAGATGYPASNLGRGISLTEATRGSPARSQRRAGGIQTSDA